MYLDYQTYKTMGGDLDNSAFIVIDRRAEYLINSQAGGKTGLRIRQLSELPQAVIDCTFDLITHLSTSADNIESESQTLGGQSESKSYISKEEINAEAFSIIHSYLYPIKFEGYSILYKGCTPWDMDCTADKYTLLIDTMIELSKEIDEKLSTMSEAKKTFCNALIGTETGRAVRVDDISPLKQTVDIDVDSGTVSPSTLYVYEYGKNLLPAPAARETEIAGVNIKINSDGTIQLKGKASRQVRLAVAQNVEMLKGQQYTLSSGYDTFQWGLDIYFYKGDTQSEVWESIGFNTGSGYITAVFPDDVSKMNVLINISPGATVDHILKLQVETGKKATEYEIYREPILHKPTEYGKLSNINVEKSTTFIIYDVDTLLTVKYNRDINKAFAEIEENLTNAILATGGNV